MEGDTSSQVAALLNDAQLMANSDSKKLDSLKKVQELIVNKDPNLLDNFLDEVLVNFCLKVLHIYIYVSDTTDHQNLNKRKQFGNSMPLLTGNIGITYTQNSA